MARKNTNAELFEQLSEIGFYRDVTSGGASSTLSAALAAGVTAVPVVSGSGFAANDIVRIGADNKSEIAAIASIASNTLTLKTKTALAHDSGAVVVEVAPIKIGDLSDDGVTMDDQTEINEINSATQRGTYASLIRRVTQRWSFAALNFSLENVLASLGIPETGVSGAGTAASPRIADVLPNLFNTQRNQSCYFKGVLYDGTAVEVQGWGVEVEPNRQVQMQSGAGVPIPFNIKVNGYRILQVDPI